MMNENDKRAIKDLIVQMRKELHAKPVKKKYKKIAWRVGFVRGKKKEVIKGKKKFVRGKKKEVIKGKKDVVV